MEMTKNELEKVQALADKGKALSQVIADTNIRLDYLNCSSCNTIEGVRFFKGYSDGYTIKPDCLAMSHVEMAAWLKPLFIEKLTQVRNKAQEQLDALSIMGN